MDEYLLVMELQAYDLWRVFSIFIDLDPGLPRQLREHFLGIERELILYQVWTKNSIVVQTLQEATKNETVNKFKESASYYATVFEALFRRLK